MELLKGLEISEVSLANARAASRSQRIDSTFFLKEFLENSPSAESIALENICIIRSGSTPLVRDENLKTGVILLKTGNIRNDILSSNQLNDYFYIDDKTDQSMSKTHLDSNDVLINIVGATTDVIGRCSLVSEDFPRANITQAMALLRIKDEFKDKYQPHFLFAYLTSSLGHDQVRRIARPTGQYNMNLEEVGSFLIPSISFEFQSKIKELISYSEAIRHKSNESYSKAEAALFGAMGGEVLRLDENTINIKKLSDSYKLTGRLDAEYYQPRYEQLTQMILAKEHSKLRDVVDILKSIEPGSDAYSEESDGVPFLRVADYSKLGIAKPQINLSSKFVFENQEKLEKLKPKKGAILFSKDGSVGEAFCLQENAEFITSGAILHLTIKNPKELLPDYLTLLLNSEIVKRQAERDAGGSIILHWRLEEVESVILPIVDIDTQKIISKAMQDCFSLKKDSENILSVARRAVEIAVQQGEESATSYVQKNINNP
ncbi:restriction endonuclease subunit S [Polynucleobacter sp. Ross1-W9]|uniref:restriction endonuclease subunit S n=1 Tax=Polynucleobacter parvulilacunae TaxID=1855631 RepID=UPI001C0C2B44|nr:restriction endonuclease subunit S [Polynucleobacter parvulilacunae]MBU3557431.1 restriction endonuclease subunit S [Polynucleobacter parvulilacunae]